MGRVTLSPEEISERYGLNIGTLANMRSRKEGPSYLKVGGKRKVLYVLSDFEKWLFSQSVKTTDNG